MTRQDSEIRRNAANSISPPKRKDIDIVPQPGTACPAECLNP